MNPQGPHFTIEAIKVITKHTVLKIHFFKSNMHFLANILLIFSNMGAFSTPRATSSGHKILLPPSPLCHRPFPPSPLPPLPPPSPHLLMLPHPSSPLPTSPHPKLRRLTLGQVQLQRSTLLNKYIHPAPGLATQEKLKSSPTMQILIKS